LNARTLKLFLALWPGDVPRRELGRWAAALHKICTGRRTRTENLHITLAFLGQIETDRLDAVVDAARSVRPCQVTLRMDQPGYWKHNNIAWLGASLVPPELDTMVGELRAALKNSAIPFDPKPFVPHVTMVRNARPPKEEWPTLLPVDWPVSGFALISSERDESGPYYRMAAGPFEGKGTGRAATGG
jgi:RNA 2',3'-cyclic 3'-phosphodiesterase